MNLGRNSLAVACLTAVHKVLGLNCVVGSCVYCKSHCDLQPWAWAVYAIPAVPRSTQPSTLRGMVNEYQLSGWVIMTNGDCCLKQSDSQPKSGGLVWGSAATWRCSTFTRWIEWTLAMTSVTMTARQHYNYRYGYYYYYYPGLWSMAVSNWRLSSICPSCFDCFTSYKSCDCVVSVTILA